MLNVRQGSKAQSIVTSRVELINEDQLIVIGS